MGAATSDERIASNSLPERNAVNRKILLKAIRSFQPHRIRSRSDRSNSLINGVKHGDSEFAAIRLSDVAAP